MRECPRCRPAAGQRTMLRGSRVPSDSPLLPRNHSRRREARRTRGRPVSPARRPGRTSRRGITWQPLAGRGPDVRVSRKRPVDRDAGAARCHPPAVSGRSRIDRRADVEGWPVLVPRRDDGRRRSIRSWLGGRRMADPVGRRVRACLSGRGADRDECRDYGPRPGISAGHRRPSAHHHGRRDHR